MKIGEKDYDVPALTLGQLRNGVLKMIQEHDELLTANKYYESIDMRGRIIAKALMSKYPELKEDEVLNALDLANIGPAWLNLLGMSGFKPGEAMAVVKDSGT